MSTAQGHITIKRSRKGDDGRGISSANIWFGLSESNVTPPSEYSYDKIAGNLQGGYYLWQCAKITYTDGTCDVTGEICLGKCSDFASVTEQYALGTESGATGTWALSYTPEKGKWLWQRTRIVYNSTDSSAKYTYIPSSEGQRIGYFGEDGEDGNGIEVQEELFVATYRKSGVTYINTLGWTTTFMHPTIDLPYVWKVVHTTYTKKSDTYSVAELISVYQNGANANILSNASFVSDDKMGAWSVKSQYSVKDGKKDPGDVGKISSTYQLQSRNSYLDTCMATAETVNYKDVLKQSIHNPSSGISKLTGGQWYTFSFWSKGAQGAISVQQTSSSYGFGIRDIYLISGKTYYITVYGSVSALALTNGKTLRTYVYNDDWSENAYAEINTTSTSSTTMTFTPLSTGIYHIGSYQYDGSSPMTGTVTVDYYLVNEDYDYQTFLYPSCVDTSYSMYVDDIAKVAGTDLVVNWKFTTSWVRHTVTFRTKTAIPSSDNQFLLFRLPPITSCSATKIILISMPKLEIGMMATGFVDDFNDLTGISGCIVRQSEWAAGVSYHNDEALTSGTRFLDVAIVTNENDGTYDMYQCKKTHTSSSTITTSNSDYWKAFNELAPVYTPLIVANNAVLRFAQTNRILITNSKQQVQGCFGGVEDETNGYPLWIGGATAAEAKFKVKYGGQLEATEASITGTINAVSGQFGSDFTDEDGNYFPNFKINGYALQSGIRGKTGWMNLTNQSLTFGSKEANGIWGHFGRNVLPILGLGSYGNSVLSITITSPSNFNSDTAGNFGAVINVSGQAKSERYAVSGSHALYIQNGDIAGLRLNTRNINWNNEDIDNMDNLIHCTNTSEITLNLPSSPKRGHTIFIWQEEAKVTLKSGNYTMYWKNESDKSFTSDTKGQMTLLTFNGYHWMVNWF